MVVKNPYTHEVDIIITKDTQEQTKPNPVISHGVDIGLYIYIVRWLTIIPGK